MTPRQELTILDAYRFGRHGCTKPTMRALVRDGYFRWDRSKCDHVLTAKGRRYAMRVLAREERRAAA